MVGGMSASSPATGLCACGGIVAGRGAAAAGGEAWRLATQAAAYASGARMSLFLGQMGPRQQPQYGMDGANSVPRRQLGFGSGLVRRGGADFLWLLTRVSPGDKAALNDGGGDYSDGGGGGGKGGGGGGGGRNDGPGDGPGPGDAGQIFPNFGAAIWFWSVAESSPYSSRTEQ